MIVSLSQDWVGNCRDGMVLVGAGSWVMLTELDCWRILAHLSQFQLISWDQALGPVLHFWQKPLLQQLHLTGTVFDHKVAEHFPHFSFISLASVKDKPWLSRDLREVVGGGADCWKGCCCCCWCCWPLWVVIAKEVWKWHFQIWVADLCCLASPWGMGNLLQARIRWDIFGQDY